MSPNYASVKLSPEDTERALALALRFVMELSRAFGSGLRWGIA